MTDGEIRVVVSGATGKMGREVIRTMVAEPGLRLVGAVASRAREDAGVVAGMEPLGIPVSANLRETLAGAEPDVLVDFTTPDAVERHVQEALEFGVRPVVGTSGVTREQVRRWDGLCRERSVGGIVAPNFAVGAVLLMRFVREAARYLPHVEIIEMHHDGKLDAPSGTAVKTAEELAEAGIDLSSGRPDERELFPGARGAAIGGVRVHSVRLPGLVAHQEVILGGPGQILTVRHDSLDRVSFMPGVVLAVRGVMGYVGMMYGLEPLLG